MKVAIVAFTLFSLAFQVLAETRAREDHLDDLSPGSKRLKTGNHNNVLVAGQPINFARCDIRQQKKVKEVAKRVTERIKHANKYLETSPLNKKRYHEWFGEFSETRYSTVQSHFRWMERQAPSVTYDCDSCTTVLRLSTSPPLAYKTENGNVKTINLCPGFWKLPIYGFSSSPSPSQSQIIIGLISMFKTMKGTKEFPGTNIREQAKRLAKASPDKAVLNAVNHAIFAETD
ncbi:hypothetical protein RSOLAG22IIIB_06832 [Rhizoctonia solani]|uniref:Lysine-specific metallo-endopeptidase domain-containing protein n=1 Tax=Rhizoctonia solani TaxID=456999 RepID=A0A0K6GHK7_9AGAM|nr:hypothetical protein RSOLAG22IIIB_06832 [Rhizoctonia solani]